jgi:hypothetical protein
MTSRHGTITRRRSSRSNHKSQEEAVMKISPERVRGMAMPLLRPIRRRLDELENIVAGLATRPETLECPQPPVAPSAPFKAAQLSPHTTLSVVEFCQRNHLGNSTFYAMKRAGVGPRFFKAGRSIRITTEAEQEWRGKMETKPSDVVVPKGSSPV